MRALLVLILLGERYARASLDAGAGAEATQSWLIDYMEVVSSIAKGSISTLHGARWLHSMLLLAPEHSEEPWEAEAE